CAVMKENVTRCFRKDENGGTAAPGRLGLGGDAGGILDVGRPPVHRYESRGPLDAMQPGADCGKGREVEVAALGDMGVAIQRDVGDGELVGGEILMGLEM